MEFRSRYDVTGVKKGTDVGTMPSMTQQQFKDDADINNIIAKYQTTGVLGDPFVQPTRTPQFGDFSQLPSFQAMQNAIIASKNAFMALPSSLRERFGNDPAKYFEFVQGLKEGTDDYAEAVKLGIVVPKTPVNDNPNPTPTDDGKHS